MRNILFAFLLLVSACTLDVERLTGKWHAVAFYESGQSLAAPLDSVALAFTGEGQYVFRSTGYYREQGPFRVSGAHLYLTDTTEYPPKEHVLKVLFLSEDTLKILMSKAERPQVLFFKRTDNQ